LGCERLASSFPLNGAVICDEDILMSIANIHLIRRYRQRNRQLLRMQSRLFLLLLPPPCQPPRLPLEQELSQMQPNAKLQKAGSNREHKRTRLVILQEHTKTSLRACQQQSQWSSYLLFSSAAALLSAACFAGQTRLWTRMVAFSSGNPGPALTLAKQRHWKGSDARKTQIELGASRLLLLH